jgi:type IV pilus assembly protein PilA
MKKGNDKGFTLIEMMIVIAMISILATMALPSYQDRIIRTQIEEALQLSGMAEEEISVYYQFHQTLPADNAVLGLPEPEVIVGNYVTALKITDGVIHITLGNRANNNIRGKVISVRPAIVPSSSKIPIAWVRGLASVPNGMTVLGENQTDLLPRHLPMAYRY